VRFRGTSFALAPAKRLTDRELDVVLAQRSSLIRALPKPPPAQVAAYPLGPVRQEYLSWFEAQEGFDQIRTWMRYRRAADIDAWVQTPRPLMPMLVARAGEPGTRNCSPGHAGRWLRAATVATFPRWCGY
jgi:hypothetical protein